jgi:hypothetical protein
MKGSIARRTKAGLFAILIALVTLFSALPASADPGNGNGNGPKQPAHAQNITWE